MGIFTTTVSKTGFIVCSLIIQCQISTSQLMKCLPWKIKMKVLQQPFAIRVIKNFPTLLNYKIRVL